jgi:hypothetical protein
MADNALEIMQAWRAELFNDLREAEQAHLDAREALAPAEHQLGAAINERDRVVAPFAAVLKRGRVAVSIMHRLTPFDRQVTRLRGELVSAQRRVAIAAEGVADGQEALRQLDEAIGAAMPQITLAAA